jgi:hypothetical protein
MKRISQGGFLLAVAWPALQVAHAATYCVNSPAELVSDLIVAQANGSADEIRIAAGVYQLTTEPNYTAVFNEDYAIEISGGWNAGCTIPHSGTTVLNGQNQVRTLAVLQDSYSLAATISVHDLTLEDGHTANGGGGLYIFNRNAASTVEGNAILLNHADQYGGGLHLATSGPVLVRNNLFLLNTAAYGGGVYVTTTDPSAYITGNTIVSNTTTQTSNGCGGLYLFAGGQTNYWISNNIVWNNNTNAAFDFRSIGANVRLYNDIGTATGTPADPISQGNVSVDPQFAPCSGFLCFNSRLKRSSPLVDAGFDGPPSGIGYTDLDGASRHVGPHVDIGAYELDRLFSDNFQ